MTCRPTKLNIAFLKGTTFHDLRVDFNLEIEKGEFEVNTLNGAVVANPSVVLAGNSAFVKLSELAGLGEARYTGNFFYTLYGHRHIAFTSDILITSDPSRLTCNSEGVAFNIVEQDMVVEVEVNPVGLQGLTGERGERGERGEPGEKGEKGDPGTLQRTVEQSNTLTFTSPLPNLYNAANPNGEDFTLDLTGAILGGEAIAFSKGASVPRVFGGSIVQQYGIYHKTHTNRLHFTHIGGGNFILEVSSTYIELPVPTASPAFPYPIVSRQSFDTNQFGTQLNTLSPAGGYPIVFNP